MNSTKICNQFL